MTLEERLKSAEGRIWTHGDTAEVLDHVRRVESDWKALVALQVKEQLRGIRDAMQAAEERRVA